MKTLCRCETLNCAGVLGDAICASAKWMDTETKTTTLGKGETPDKICRIKRASTRHQHYEGITAR